MDNDFTYKVNEIRVESRAAANAIRALQDRIQVLETDKENLQNHIEFLIQNHPDPAVARSQRASVDSRESSVIKQNNDKLIDNLEILLSKAEFLEKELRRKEQQFFIDKENWNLERKMMMKDISLLRARVKESKEKKDFKESNGKFGKKEEKRSEGKKGSEKKKIKVNEFKANTDRPADLQDLESPDHHSQDLQLSLIFEDKISQLTQRLKDSEFQRRQTEDLLQKSRISYSNNLETLEYEIKSLRQAASPEVYLKEIDSLKKIVKDQNSEIERLSFELQDWKVNYQKLEELSLFLKKAPPKFEVQQKPIKELEENVERLSCKYKELLSRTRKQDENYPELRNELRQTAFELEYQSFLLFQQRKNEESSQLRE